MTVVQQGNGHLVANARVFDWSLLVKFFLSHLRQKPPICFGFDLSLPFSFLYTKNMSFRPGRGCYKCGECK